MHEGFYQMWYFMPLMPILMFIVFILLIYFLFRGCRLNSSRHMQSFRETPLDILRIRYAKGEITKEQFENMKRDIL